MHVISGPVRYYFLRKARGQEDVDNWPPIIKPLEGPDNKVCTAVRLYATNSGWRAECGDEPATANGTDGADGADGATSAVSATEMPLMLTRATVLGLLQEGRRARGEAGLLGVRVVNADGQGTDYATHFIVNALPGAGLSPRRPVVVPIDSLVLGEYVEHANWAEAQLDLRMTPGDYSGQPLYLSDEMILRNANDTLDRTVHANAHFTYGEHPHRDITAEVEDGRVTLFGMAAMHVTGDQASAALLGTPGVLEVVDRILYLDDLQDVVEDALTAKGFDTVLVLVEHALVVLSGEVASSKQRWQAEDIAKKIPGVRGVVNDIVVAAPTTA
ncbi:MAG: BON domain-containing protein [Ktedonobacterales bacterium]